MSIADDERWSDELPRCTACKDVIGVYEPLVHMFDGLARRTSRAAEPDVLDSAGDRYHLECYTRLAGGP